MQKPHAPIIRSMLLALVAALSMPTLAGCDTEDDVLADTDTEDAAEWSVIKRVKFPPSAIPVGAQWGPCDLSNVQDPGWWGCDGGPGFGLACARPASDTGLNICVPQTADASVDEDCGNITAPFGLGVRLQGSAYCVADCLSDSDCAGGMECAAAGLCAWVY